MSWFKKTFSTTAAVLFPGEVPPPAESFSALADAGYRLAKAASCDPKHYWEAELSHPKYGSAQVVCLRESIPLPEEVVNCDSSLIPEERAEALTGRSCVLVTVSGSTANLLRDRKSLLRFARAIMGGYGAVVLDMSSQRLWSRDALDTELAHDADLDVQGLYVGHYVTAGEDENAPTWFHTHGLASIGFFDFDIFSPSPDLLQRGRVDHVLAYAIVEDALKSSTASFPVARPKGSVRMVDVGTFRRKGPGQYTSFYDDDDEDHTRDRSVACEPEGLFSRLLGKVTPSRFLSRGDADRLVVQYSDSATELMSQRAQATFGYFRELAAEMEPVDCAAVVKIGYPVDNGGPTDCEHMWFTMHGATDSRIDATLENEPFQIAAMHAGQRGEHPLELLTDWAVVTPLGMITPRDTLPARVFHRHKDEIIEAYKKASEAE